MSPQPRRYRIRVYDQGAEVLHGRQYAAVLDLTPGPGLRAAEAQLDALVQTLAYADGARGRRVLGYHLTVEDPDTGEELFDWPAKTWPDR